MVPSSSNLLESYAPVVPDESEKVEDSGVHVPDDSANIDDPAIHVAVGSRTNHGGWRAVKIASTLLAAISSFIAICSLMGSTGFVQPVSLPVPVSATKARPDNHWGWLDDFQEKWKWHPGLKRRMAEPNITEDLEELRSIGITHPDLHRLLSWNFSNMSANKLADFMPQRVLGQSPATCKAYTQCSAQGLDGNCCPTSDGTMLDCCKGGFAPWYVEHEKRKNDIKYTKCGFHVFQSALYLSEAALSINAAVGDCPQPTHAIRGRHRGQDARVTCAVDIQGILQGFGWTAFFIMDSANFCAKTSNAQVACGAQISGLIAALFDLGEGATAIATDCTFVGNVILKSYISDQMNNQNSNPSVEPTALGFCVMDPMQSIYWLFRAALFIKGAVEDCPKHSENDKEGCAVDLLYVISSFGWAASFLASAASDCAVFVNSKANCASDLADVVSASTMCAAQGIAIKSSCNVFSNHSVRGFDAKNANKR
mmetsp:Transcript_55224/g.118731  ORF Transcript_55224/g.118731 Transcript_55224/m.118731 type:complete len:482 (+) Transcript_55224:66-1511(+)